VLVGRHGAAVGGRDDAHDALGFLNATVGQQPSKRWGYYIALA
jgi:hypothetical protein